MWILRGNAGLFRFTARCSYPTAIYKYITQPAVVICQHLLSLDTPLLFKKYASAPSPPHAQHNQRQYLHAHSTQPEPGYWLVLLLHFRSYSLHTDSLVVSDTRCSMRRDRRQNVSSPREARTRCSLERHCCHSGQVLHRIPTPTHGREL